MKKALGIIGGMGPGATVDFFCKVVDLTMAERDQEHIRIYIDNHPQIPDRIAAMLNGTGDPLPALMQSLAKLEACGADVIAMPCVSAHFFMPKLAKEAKAQTLDMLDLTVQACSKNFPGKRAGLLASTGTAKSRIVSDKLEQAGIEVILPKQAEQEELARIILQIKAEQTAQTLPNFEVIANEMAVRGTDYFVLACTEIPIIAAHAHLPRPAICATTVLARAAVLACGYKLRDEIAGQSPQ